MAFATSPNLSSIPFSRLRFFRVSPEDFPTKIVKGTPPYYLCYREEDTYNTFYISSSDVLPQYTDAISWIPPHSIFAMWHQPIKLADLRTVLSVAALMYPERFVTPSNNYDTNVRAITNLTNTVIRILPYMMS